MPVDIVFGLGEDGGKAPASASKYLREFRESMQEADRKATLQPERSGQCQRDHFNRNTRAIHLQLRDRVLVKNMTERGGPGKLTSYWEEEVYKVIRRFADEVPGSSTSLKYSITFGQFYLFMFTCVN